MRPQVQQYINGCLTYARSKDPHAFKNKKKHAIHQPLPLPDGPGQQVQADIHGPLKTSKAGKSYLLVITDAWSKWTEVIALDRKDAETVGPAIFNQWICRYGCMRQLVINCGTDFSSLVGETLY